MLRKSVKEDLKKALYLSDKDWLIKIISQDNFDINDLSQFSIDAVDCRTDNRNTPKHIDLIKFLIDLNVRFDVMDEFEFNALHISLICGDIPYIARELLVLSDIDIHKINSRNENAILLALEQLLSYKDFNNNDVKDLNFKSIWFEIVKTLLERKADIDFKNKSGISSRELIEKSKIDELKELIK